MLRPLVPSILAAGFLAGAPLAAQTAPAVALPRAQFLAEMDNEFRKRDADHDGKVTRAELETWERNQSIAAAQAQNRAEFLRLDVDRNGMLSPGEFAALARAPSVVDVGPLMGRFDPNRDQTVTLIEWRAATLANFDTLDADHDGVVTPSESAGKIR